MYRKSVAIIGIAAFVLGTGERATFAVVSEQVTGLKAFYRDGQTFVTWTEPANDTGAWFKVYAAAQRITADNLEKATLIAKVPQGSNHFGFFRNVDTVRTDFFKTLLKEPWAKAIQIEDDQTGAKQLSDGTGLFVRTIRKDAKTQYAVTIERGGVEDRAIVSGANSLDAPVAEKVAPLGAVLQRKMGDRYYTYAFFCPFDEWNPDGIDDNWDGYAHVFRIRAPQADDKETKEPYPVSFRLHAYTAWQDWNVPYTFPHTHVCVRLLDYHLTWWYGYSSALPKTDSRTRVPPPATIVNYTEQRVRQVAQWLMANPTNFPFKVDPMRFSVEGGSMGGTGTHYLSQRNGDIFASAHASEGIFNWGMPPKYSDWVGNVASKFGPQDRNDPTNEGAPVYDVLNLIKWSAAHAEKETAYLDTDQGTMDFVIPFREVVDYWRASEKGKHPFAAGWGMVGHMPWYGSRGPMDYREIRKDEVVPAFANASCNTPLKSGFRIAARAATFTERGLTIKPGQLKGADGAGPTGGFPPGLAGMTLVIGPSEDNRDVFTIQSNTDTELTIVKGDVAAYLPPVTQWDQDMRKNEIAKQEGLAKPRDLTADEKRALAEKTKQQFLICDGQPRGCWNAHFAWSTAAQDFDRRSTDDDIVDSTDRLAICIRLSKNGLAGECPTDTATADVTPRRAQHFKPAPGQKVRWENWDCADPTNPKRLAEGDVVADANGLVTVEKFVIGKKGWGNRLVLTTP